MRPLTILALVVSTPVVVFSANVTNPSVSHSYSPGMDQTKYFEEDFYCHHIVAVDENGDAMLPVVTRTKAGDGSFHYTAKSFLLDDEDMRGAKVNSAALASDAASGKLTQPPPYNKQMMVALNQENGPQTSSNFSAGSKCFKATAA